MHSSERPGIRIGTVTKVREDRITNDQGLKGEDLLRQAHIVGEEGSHLSCGPLLVD